MRVVAAMVKVKLVMMLVNPQIVLGGRNFSACLAVCQVCYFHVWTRRRVGENNTNFSSSGNS